MIRNTIFYFLTPGFIALHTYFLSKSGIINFNIVFCFFTVFHAWRNTADCVYNKDRYYRKLHGYLPLKTEPRRGTLKLILDSECVTNVYDSVSKMFLIICIKIFANYYWNGEEVIKVIKICDLFGDFKILKL